MNNHFSWALALLGAVLATFVGVISAAAMNYRDWNPGTFTGWTLYGFILLALGIVLLVVLVWMSLTGDSSWTTFVAFIIGITVGIGSVLYFQSTDIEWKAALLGLGCFGSLASLIAGIGYLSGSRD